MINMKTILKIFGDNFELLFFVSALIFLFIKPEFTDNFSLCVLHNVGFEYCPGCGLGSSIHEGLHLNFRESLSLHPLGIFAVFVITIRIVKLIFSLIRDLKNGQNFTDAT